MNSVLKLVVLVLSTALLTSCSSVEKNHERIHLVDFKAHQQKTVDILARTSDLKKYKMSKVSF